MSWSEIKHALNSTLGTDEFKSLDKIINENSYVIASSETLYNWEGVFSTTEKIPSYSTKTYSLPKKIKTLTFGYFNVRASVKVSGGYTSDSFGITFNCYKNGILANSTEASSKGSFEDNMLLRVDFEPADILTFELVVHLGYSVSSNLTTQTSVDILTVLGTVKTTTFKPVPIETEE